MSKTFADFSLDESLTQALDALGFTTPTPVQEQAIPAALEGKDLLVSSQTGSGKTALLKKINALSNIKSSSVEAESMIFEHIKNNVFINELRTSTKNISIAKFFSFSCFFT